MPTERILVFRTSSLGDTLAGVPALWAIRRQFPEARLTLLCDQQVGRSYVLARDILDDAQLVDDYLFYPVDRSRAGKFLKPLRMLWLLVLLRLRRYDKLIYLGQSRRRDEQVKRDLRFFRWARINNFIATQGFDNLPEKILGQPLPATPHETDMLLARLNRSGIPTPPDNLPFGRPWPLLHVADFI